MSCLSCASSNSQHLHFGGKKSQIFYRAKAEGLYEVAGGGGGGERGGGERGRGKGREGLYEVAGGGRGAKGEERKGKGKGKRKVGK